MQAWKHTWKLSSAFKAQKWIEESVEKLLFRGKTIHSWFWFQATGSCRTAPDPRWAKTSPTTSLWVQCPSGSICDHMNSWRLSHSLLRSRMHCSRVGKTDLSTWRDLGMQKLVSVSLANGKHQFLEYSLKYSWLFRFSDLCFSRTLKYKRPVFHVQSIGCNDDAYSGHSFHLQRSSHRP